PGKILGRAPTPKLTSGKSARERNVRPKAQSMIRSERGWGAGARGHGGALGAALLAAGLALGAAPPSARAEEPASALAKLPPLQVQIDLADVDLAGGELTLRMSRP